MGYRKDEAKSKGALSSSSFSISKIQRARRKFLNKLSRASTIIRTVSIPKCKHYWSSSEHDGDIGAVQSQGSKLRRSTLTEPNGIAADSSGKAYADSSGYAAADSSGNAADSSPSPSSECRSHGLHLWDQTREQWVGDKKKTRKRRQVRDPKLSPDETYESLLENNNEPFAEPVPLIEMVIFLVDEWEQEGMYDINNVMLH